MTMLEKIARAACAHIVANDPDFTPWDELTDKARKEYLGLGRAFLEAIREPDDVVLNGMDAGLDFSNTDSAALFAGEWRGAIDAILNEGQ